MGSRAKAVPTAASADDTTVNAAVRAAEADPAAGDMPIATSDEPDEPPVEAEQPTLAERLTMLGLDLGSDDMVAIIMLTSMEGPGISLARLAPHRCDPEEAIRLVQARFAKPA